MDGSDLLLPFLTPVHWNDVQLVEAEVERSRTECSHAQNTERRPRPVRFHQKTSDETSRSSAWNPPD